MPSTPLATADEVIEERQFCPAQNVRFWHKADIQTRSINVRFWG